MKIERVYREVLYNFLEQANNKFKQKYLSKECKISLSTVNYALKPLEKIGAIEKKNFGFSVIDARKILNFWATIRKLDKDIVYKKFINEKIERIESLMPARCVFTAYTAFKLKFNEIPSDYGEVIVYGKREDFEERFGKQISDKANLIVLNLDEHLSKFKIAPIAQIYVDLWNLGTWYASEFFKKLEVKINGILERYNY